MEKAANKVLISSTWKEYIFNCLLSYLMTPKELVSIGYNAEIVHRKIKSILMMACIIYSRSERKITLLYTYSDCGRTACICLYVEDLNY